MDEDLFTEPKDIDDIINKKVQDAIKAQNKDGSDDNESEYALADILMSTVKAFRKAGFSRKESVYLVGQISGSFIGNLLGGLMK